MNIPQETSTWRAEKADLAARDRKAAFSLIEMLISLALVLIMSVMLYGFGSRSYQEKQKGACRKNLLKIYVAMEIFANDHEGSFPFRPGAQTAEEALDLLVPRYTVDTSSFICPGSKDSQLPSGESFSTRKISYAYVMGHRLTEAQELLMSDKQVNTLPKSPGQEFFSVTGKPPGNNHHKYGGNCLFVDGRVEVASASPGLSLVWTRGVVLLNPKP